MRVWGWISLLLVCSGLVSCILYPTKLATQSTTFHLLNTHNSLNHGWELPIYQQILHDFHFNPLTLPQKPPYMPQSIHNFIEATVIIVPPTCYDAPNYRVQCLGRVYNPLDDAVERVVLRVNLLNGHGDIRKQQVISLEQHAILPGESAPYRVFFENVTESQVITHVELQHVQSFRYEAPPAIVVDENGQLQFQDRGYGRYQVSGTLKNMGNTPIQDFAAVVTLYDSRYRVVGYRVLPIDDVLQPKHSKALSIEVIPQVIDSNYQHTVHIDFR